MSRAHAWLVRHVTYPLWQRRSGGTVLPALRRLQQTQWLDEAALRALQWTRVRALVAHAHARVPFYRERWSALGFDLDDFRSLDDLGRLPSLEKCDVRDQATRIRAEGAPGRLVERKTSGSTGVPVVIYAEPAARDQWVAARMRALEWWDIEPGDRRVTLISRQALGRDRWLKQYWIANTLEYSAMDLSDVTLHRLTARLADPGVRAMLGYPSSLAYLARYIESSGLPPPAGLRLVITTGEVLFDDVRALLRRVFRCPVATEYGSSETGHVAGECPYGRLHIAAENVLVEADAAGELLLTDLTNFAMPLIRYRIGDLGRLGEPCSCGRGLPVLALEMGRIEDLVVLPDGRRLDAGIFGVVVDELTKLRVPFRQFHVIQHAVNRFEVLIAGGSGLDGVSGAVARRLVEALGASVTVTVRAVDTIPPERTGKRRKFISHVAQIAERPDMPPPR
jgi:phenylacetate-CoA ligase